VNIRGATNELQSLNPVAARGFLPPGANVCVAAPSSQIGNGNWYSYGHNDGIGLDCEQYANLGV